MNADLLNDNDEIPQLSDDPLLIFAVVRVAFPELFKAKVKLVVKTVGLVTSVIVTVAAHESTLPEPSVTTKYTVLVPMLEQVKKLLLIVVLAIEQLSDDPLLICDAVIVAVPEPLRGTEMF